MATGKVWLVGAGPGDPDLITVLGRRALRRADVVLYDALSHPALLEHCRAEAELRNVGKRGGRKSPSQSWITEQLIELARGGRQVVRLKGGDPMLFARGAEEALDLAAAGIEFEIVPGLSSPVAAAAYAGVPLTHRDLSSSVTFITGSDRAGVDWSPDAWRRLATATDTICVLMGMRRIEAITQAIVDGGRDPATPAAVVMWGARPEQRVVVGTVADIAERAREAGLTNPAVIIVGDGVALRDQLRWYDARPLFGRRVLVPRPPHQSAETAAAIRSRGAAPVPFAMIEIADPPDRPALRAASNRLGDYDWVVFTSANGVERLFVELDRDGRDARAFAGAKIGVIGPKTGRALEQRGVRPDVVASEHTGEGLASELLASTPRRVLILRALEAREALPRLLREAGVEVDVVPAYQTRRSGADRADELRAMLDEGSLDVVMFTSSSTARSVVELLGASAGERLGKVTVASIGPITSSTLAELGIDVDVVAARYTIDGLLDALEEHYPRER